MNYIEAVNNIEEGGVKIQPITLIKQSIYQAISGITNGSFQVMIPLVNSNKEIIFAGDSLTYYYYIKETENRRFIKMSKEIVISEVVEDENNLTLTLNEQLVIPSYEQITLPTISEVLIKRQSITNITFETISRDGFLLKVMEKDKGMIYIDKIIQQGQEYNYTITGIKVMVNGEEQIEEDETILFAPDFEDIFLTDGIRNYRVLYNPKIQSFKTVIAEQKVDTIGGRFPIFVRNGNLNYKEIPISGMIATVPAAEDQTFRVSTPAPAYTNKTSAEKIAEERRWKIEIEQWLRNGQPKIFRSPAEGNYIIRLMNVSLSPNDTLGRVYHSFSATGYEVMEYNEENLIKMGVIPVQPESEG